MNVSAFKYTSTWTCHVEGCALHGASARNYMLNNIALLARRTLWNYTCAAVRIHISLRKQSQEQACTFFANERTRAHAHAHWAMHMQCDVQSSNAHADAIPCEAPANRRCRRTQCVGACNAMCRRMQCKCIHFPGPWTTASTHDLAWGSKEKRFHPGGSSRYPKGRTPSQASGMPLCASM